MESREFTTKVHFTYIHCWMAVVSYVRASENNEAVLGKEDMVTSSSRSDLILMHFIL